MAALPDWLDPLPDSELQRATDAWAIDTQGVDSLDLMERAGEGLARLTEERAGEGRIAVVCGKGNNAGDGLVAARLLRDWGHEVDVLCVAPADEFDGDAKANLDRLPGTGPAAFSGEAVAGAAIVVDALLGTGFAGDPREPVASAIAAINAAGTPVVAADVPSGADASTGEIAGEAVRADATATFHAPKPGLWINPGKAHAGEVRRVPIGIPAGAPGEPSIGLISAAVLDRVPRRHAGSTKFTEGAVLVCGGSAGLTGAPSLASEAAARAGAGYVTACVPGSLSQIFEVRLLEAMTRPLADDGGDLVAGAADAVLEAAGRADALVLGCGIGRSESAQDLARDVAARAELPLLLDADGLNAHVGRLPALAGRDASTVLTPHAGELGRLLGIESATVDARRLHYARAAAAAAAAVVVLKGDDTLVADPAGRVAVSRGASAGLATAGTGDVLSGVTGAMLAKGLDPFTAACAGVALHAAAGRRAAELRGADGLIARDVIEALPRELADR